MSVFFRMRVLMERLRKPMAFSAALMTCIVGGYRLFIEKTETILPIIDWHENYFAYQDIVLERQKNYFVIITQFKPKNKCYFIGPLTGFGTQNIGVGALYTRALKSTEMNRVYPMPPLAKGWVRLAPIRLASSGFSNGPIKVYFEGVFRCAGQLTRIKFPFFVVPSFKEGEDK